ncbi:MAG: class I adenylate-forming enzyme family protein [Gemmatimonadota bacterium]
MNHGPDGAQALLERVEGATVASALTARATSDPARPYLRTDEMVVRYGEVESQAEALAAALSGLGVRAGDRVALVLPACPEFAVSMYAVAKLGGIVVPLNPHLAPLELQYMLRHSEAVCCVTIEQDRDVDFLQLFEEIMPQLPELRHLVTVGEEDLWYDDRIFQFEDLVSAGSGRDFAGGAADPGDCFALLYTSGTSGKPKGVELSHRNLLSVAAGTAGAIGLNEDDIGVGISALFHVYGLGPGLLGTLTAGASLVLVEHGDAAAMLDAAERHAATVYYGIPTLFVGAVAQMNARARNVSSVRLAVVAGAPIDDQLMSSVTEAFDATVVSGYSVTETASTVSTTGPRDGADKRRFTVGRPLPGTSVRIVEETAAGDVELPEESVGEIRVKGPGVMLGYYRQPKETADSFDADGFFRTGDLGIIDEDGFLHLVGRNRDVIIRSGFNVYPREVESRIEAHPAVREAAAIGVADPLLGEAICACVVPVEGAIVTGHEIVDWCRDTLADEKVPDSVRFVDELPRTDTGQVRRVELSRMLMSEGQSA